MESQKQKTSDLIASSQHVTLLELLDRLLDRGVMVKGEILLTVADIDLVYLNLGLLLSSVRTVKNVERRSWSEEAKQAAWQTFPQAEFLDRLQLEEKRSDLASTHLSEESSHSSSSSEEAAARVLPSTISRGLDHLLEPKASVDPENVEKGLAKLVLTLVDLIRRLMEKQAIRRIDDGQLNPGEVEKLGYAFLLLSEKMEQLKETFGLTDEDLNLDLGPLGELY